MTVISLGVAGLSFVIDFTPGLPAGRDLVRLPAGQGLTRFSAGKLKLRLPAGPIAVDHQPFSWA